MQAPHDAAREQDVVVPLRSRRRKRALVAQKTNHVVPALGWDEIAFIRVTAREADVRTHDSRRRRIDLSDIENAAEVRAALTDASNRLAAVADTTAIEKPA